MQSGQEVDLTIETTGFGGDGIGRLDGMAVFVRGALPGETVRVQLTNVRKRFAHGTLRAILSASPDRVVPACPLADDCPGCSYQALRYAAELDAKTAQLQGLLEKLGGFSDVSLEPPIGAPNALGYRNKIVLHSDGEGRLGYYGLDNRSILDVDCCPLAVPPIQAALPDIRQRWKDRLTKRDALTLRWTETDGVVHWVNRDAPRTWLTEREAGRLFQVPADGFWQVNPDMTPALVQHVRALLRRCQPRYVLDLYCGAGLFALLAAEAGAEHVLGVELQTSAIRAARRNASGQGLEQVLFAVGESAKLYPEAMQRVENTSACLIVDPPREGLSQSLCARLSDPNVAGPESLLYISCAPDTLARDLKQLCAAAYCLQQVQLLDMFPRTAHFESVALLQRQAVPRP